MCCGRSRGEAQFWCCCNNCCVLERPCCKCVRYRPRCARQRPDLEKSCTLHMYMYRLHASAERLLIFDSCFLLVVERFSSPLFPLQRHRRCFPSSPSGPRLIEFSRVNNVGRSFDSSIAQLRGLVPWSGLWPFAEASRRWRCADESWQRRCSSMPCHRLATRDETRPGQARQPNAGMSAGDALTFWPRRSSSSRSPCKPRSC